MAAWDPSIEQEEIVYSTTTIPSRGITTAVVVANKPSYAHVKLSATRNFVVPDSEYWKVYYYDADGRVSKVTPSLTVPAP